MDAQGFAADLAQQEELITKIGEELSLHNKRLGITFFEFFCLPIFYFLFICRNSERMRAMAVLSQITRDNLFSLWDKHFKMIFLLLIETLKDNDPDIRRMALKLLKEIWWFYFFLLFFYIIFRFETWVKAFLKQKYFYQLCKGFKNRDIHGKYFSVILKHQDSITSPKWH